MKVSTVYELTCLLDLVPGVPSLLIPVFVHSRSNVPYVQSLDQYYSVTRLDPYYYADEYAHALTREGARCEVGQRGWIGMRTHDLRVVCWQLPKIFEYVDEVGDELRHHKVLWLQLLRIIGAEQRFFEAAWTSLAAETFSTTAQQQLWVSTERVLHQKNKLIWDSIEPISKKSKNLLYFEAGDDSPFDYEKVLRLLDDATRYEAVDWVETWLYLLQEAGPDIRPFFVAERWLYGTFDNTRRANDVVVVFCTLLNRNVSGLETAFVEFVSEQLVDDYIYSQELNLPEKFLFKSFELARGFLPDDAYRDILLRVLEKHYFGNSIVRYVATEFISINTRLPLAVSDIARARDIIAKLKFQLDDYVDADLITDLQKIEANLDI